MYDVRRTCHINHSSVRWPRDHFACDLDRDESNSFLLWLLSFSFKKSKWKSFWSFTFRSHAFFPHSCLIRTDFTWIPILHRNKMWTFFLRFPSLWGMQAKRVWEGEKIVSNLCQFRVFHHMLWCLLMTVDDSLSLSSWEVKLVGHGQEIIVAECSQLWWLLRHTKMI